MGVDDELAFLRYKVQRVKADAAHQKKGEALNPLAFACYRHQIIRAVTGNKPAMVFHVVDNTALSRICERLVEAERAAEILLHKGYGKAGQGLLIHEVAALVPPKSK